MNLPIPRRREPQPDPENEFDRLRSSLVRDLDRWPGFASDLLETVHDVVPLADIEESDDGYLLEVELPGVKRDDVSLEVSEGLLVVTGERRERRRVGLLRHRARTSGRFRLEVSLPLEVDTDRVTAALEAGVLTVNVPKVERARRRRIPIGSPRR